MLVSILHDTLSESRVCSSLDDTGCMLYRYVRPGLLKVLYCNDTLLNLYIDHSRIRTIESTGDGKTWHSMAASCDATSRGIMRRLRRPKQVGLSDDV